MRFVMGKKTLIKGFFLFRTNKLTSLGQNRKLKSSTGKRERQFAEESDDYIQSSSWEK